MSRFFEVNHPGVVQAQSPRRLPAADRFNSLLELLQGYQNFCSWRDDYGDARRRLVLARRTASNVRVARDVDLVGDAFIVAANDRVGPCRHWPSVHRAHHWLCQAAVGGAAAGLTRARAASAQDAAQRLFDARQLITHRRAIALGSLARMVHSGRSHNVHFCKHGFAWRPICKGRSAGIRPPRSRRISQGARDDAFERPFG